MPIELKGLAFDQPTITELERQLTALDYDPGIFAVAKAKHYALYAPFPMGAEYDYTVSIEGKRFSITMFNDQQFSRFLYDLCNAPDDTGHHPIEHMLSKLFERLEGLSEITKHWLTETY